MATYIVFSIGFVQFYESLKYYVDRSYLSENVTYKTVIKYYQYFFVKTFIS